MTESHKGTETDVTERWVLKALVPSLELETVISERALGGHVAQIVFFFPFFFFFLANKETETQRGETALLRDLQKVRGRAGARRGCDFAIFRMLFWHLRFFSLLVVEGSLT